MHDDENDPALAADANDDADEGLPPVPVRRRGIAVFLALGGLWGVVNTVSQAIGMVNNENLLALLWLVLLPLIAYLFCTIDGALLWTRKRVGLWLGLAALIPQAIAVRVNDFEYSFSTGFATLLGLSSSGEADFGIGFLLRPGSHLTLGHSGDETGSFVMINLVAAVCIVLLLPLFRYSMEEA